MNAKKLLVMAVVLWLFALPAYLQADIRYTITDLGTLPLRGTNYGSHTTAINNRGQVIGEVMYRAIDYSYHRHAFIWDGTIHDIAAFNGCHTAAYGINNNGVVVGTLDWNSMFIYDQTIREFDACPEPVAINDNGWIIGRKGLFYNENWHELGSLYNWETCPTAINNKGQVAGYIREPYNGGLIIIGGHADGRAFLYDGDTLHDLGLMPDGATSSAAGINDHGLVVGWGYTFRENYGDGLGTHAFLYDGASIHDLNDLIDPASGWMLSCASDINNHGQIVGSGRNALGQWHAFLLTPVPEPSSIMSLGTAILALAGMLRYRRR